ncbi:ATP12 family chaperone protein [Croceicoccus mobilis]|uniref:ATPase n=1 Tax=Croceicoccus mobilis TaxID=1703339 RepID=A0A916YRS4_9SPHN|nr:ATP12 family protein [Croceicoccus mobilis]GGD56630.1 ATPase [Croceicoccus mobilis]
MKRFYREVTVREDADGWQVMLDGRPLKTQGGAQQIVPSRALADMLAAEWDAQGDKIDPQTFPMRDMTDYAIDRVAKDPAAVIASILPYAETDTLCYRADDGDALRERQDEAWEPLVCDAEARLGCRFSRAAGIVFSAHPPETMAAMHAELEAMDAFTLAALQNLASLAASLIAGLAALSPDADVEALFAAANLEEDWQAQQWGWDGDALARRGSREAGFRLARDFALAARG